MPTSFYHHVLVFFAEKMKQSPPSNELLESGIARLKVDDILLTLCSYYGNRCVLFQADLGYFLVSPPHSVCKEILTANFLGQNTMGMALGFAKNGVTLKLSLTLMEGTPLPECWKRLLDFLDVYVFWNQKLRESEAFTPLINFSDSIEPGTLPNLHMRG